MELLEMPRERRPVEPDRRWCHPRPGRGRWREWRSPRVPHIARIALIACTTLGLTVAHGAWSEEPREPARGTFLIASRDLVDPNFRETVVLLLEYGEAGAVGLVVNRPSEIPLHRLVPYIAGLRERKDTVYIGGPVEPLRMTFVFRADRRHEDALPVFDDVWASSRFDLLESTVEEGKSPFRVYAGYAGWAPLQLDAEIERGDWFVLEAVPAAVFSREPQELWRQLIQQTELRVVRGPFLSAGKRLPRSSYR